MIGETISHYTILEKLGEGGMGIVYKAEDTRLKRIVALKFLSSQTLATEEEKTRFVLEARTSAALDHPNICTTYQIDKAEDRIFIAMAYVEGATLLDMIRSGPLDYDTAIDIALQICEGLSEAQSKEIVHRDIKPANILLTDKGQVKITDFGLAKSAKRPQITRTATIMGTASYMSPEQARGETVDHRTDIWSLGVILYEMLTGNAPFEASSDAALLHKIIYEDPSDITSFSPNIPEGLRAIVARAMQKERDDRYSTTAELASDLRRFQSSVLSGAAFDIAPAATRPMDQPERKSRRRLPVKAIAAAIVIFLLGGWFAAGLIRHNPERHKFFRRDNPPSIIVLPFTNMTGTQDHDYFCDGLTEELIINLGQLSDLRVVARMSTFTHNTKDIDIREIVKKLDAQTILEGTVRKAGNKLRITVRLIDVKSNFQLIWAEEYQSEQKEDIFTVQDEIAMAIVENLQVNLLGGEREKLTRRYTDNSEAYLFYLKGLSSLNQRGEKGLEDAIEYFEKAIEMEDCYAPAYAGLADSYFFLPTYSSVVPMKAYPKAWEAALRALECDDTVAEAHVAMAKLKASHWWDWEGAEKEFLQAIELNPGYLPARHDYALFLACMGRYDEAMVQIKNAQALDALSPLVNRDTGLILFYSGRYEESIETLKETVELDNDFSLTHFDLGMVYLSQSSYEDALKAFQQELAVSGEDNIGAQALLGVTYARMGDKEQALDILEEMLEDLQKRSEDQYVSPFFVAILQFALGDNNRGFESLNMAKERHDYWLRYIKVSPLFDQVRSDPRFKALLEEMNLAETITEAGSTSMTHS